MTPGRSHRPLAALLALAALAAGCGGDDGSGSAAGSSTLGVADISGLGKILVDSNGRSVYLFEKDPGPRSSCSGACAQAWPPVTTNGKPSGGDGVTASMLGTTRRSNGTLQVTYDGHPLYRYQGDREAGDTAGQGSDAFGAEWYVVSPAGAKVEGQATERMKGGYSY